VVHKSAHRGWFFWLAWGVSTLALSALVGAFVIGLRANGSASALTRPSIVLYLLVALSFWSLGALIGIMKPDEPTIRIGFFAVIFTALQLAARALDPMLAGLSPPEFTFSRLLFLTSPLHFAFAFEFFYRFPAGPIPGRVWTSIRAAVWSIAIVVWALRLPSVWRWAFGGPGINDTWVWPMEQSAEYIASEREHRRHVLRSPEQASWMKSQHGTLAVPIRGAKGSNTGLLILGEKRSEEPYTSKDRSRCCRLPTRPESFMKTSG